MKFERLLSGNKVRFDHGKNSFEITTKETFRGINIPITILCKEELNTMNDLKCIVLLNSRGKTILIDRIERLQNTSIYPQSIEYTCPNCSFSNRMPINGKTPGCSNCGFQNES